jgi:hypothetical protein
MKKHHNGLGVRKRSYTQLEKIAFLKEAKSEEELGTRFPLKAIADLHNIPANSLYKWSKDPLLSSPITPSNKRKIHFGRPLKSPAANDLVVQKANELREQKLPVTGRNMAMLLSSEFQEEFGARSITQNRRTVYSIFKRNNWTVRQVTNEQTVLDEQQLGDAKIAFVQSFINRIADLYVPNDLIINMDETPSKKIN